MRARIHVRDKAIRVLVVMIQEMDELVLMAFMKILVLHFPAVISVKI